MINRIITKLFSIIDNTRWNSYYKVCINKGMKIGENVTLHHKIDFGSEPFLIEIGKNTRIAKGVSFINHSGGQMLLRKVKGYEDVRVFGRIKIGENCFIGSNTTITHGVNIGSNCVIAASSIVASSIPENTVYGGIPAKFICSVETYYENKKRENVSYPRELEADRKALEKYIKEHIPHEYKPVKK